MFLSMWIFVSAVQCVVALQPKSVKAVRTDKDMLYQGTTYNYVVYDVDYDQELYLANNYPCSCIYSCPNKDEESLNVEATELDKGQWIESTMTGDFILTKFYLPKNEGCKIVRVILSDHWGSVTGYIGVGRIPSPTDYDFVKFPKGRDEVRICPSDEKWNWGWWYVLIVSTEDRTLDHFEVSWNTIEPSRCTGEVQTDNYTLVNNVAYSSEVTSEEYQHFKFFPSTNCTNISVSLRGKGELYTSFSNEQPTELDYEYASRTKEDNVVTLMNICLGGSFYITVRSVSSFTLVATTDATFTLRPLKDIPPQQLIHSLSYGQVSLECDTSVYLCEHPAYEGCLDRDSLNCCGKFSPIIPIENSHPWRTVPTDLSREYSSLPWKMSETPTNLLSRRLSFMQYLNKESSSEGRIFSKNEQCRIRFGKGITNSVGESVNDVTSFEEEHLDCNISEEFHLLISKVERETDLNTLKKYDVFHSLLINSDGIIGCRTMLSKVFTYVDYNITYLSRCCTEGNCCDSDCSYGEDTITVKKAVDVLEGFSLGSCLMSNMNYYIAKGKTNRVCNIPWNKDIEELREATGLVDVCTSSSNIYSCLWDNMNLLTKKSLTNYWNLDNMINRTSFYENLRRYERDLCTGPGSLEFRPHYTYDLVVPSCVDDCPKIFCGSDNCENSCTSHVQCQRKLTFQDSNNDSCERRGEGCHDCTSGSCVSISLTEVECEELRLSATETYSCFLNSIFTDLSERNCSCSGGTWKSIPAREIEWYPTRTISRDLDGDSFYKDLVVAVSRLNSLQNSNNMKCRNQTTKIYHSLDCVTNGGSNCFYIHIDAEEQWVCPGLNTTISYGVVELNNTINYGDFFIYIGENVLPQKDGCQKIDVDVYPITSYQHFYQSRFSSQSFTEQPSNSWSVVKMYGFMIVGQMLTNSISISWKFEAEDYIELCIPMVLYGEEVDDKYTDFEFGRVDEGTIYPYSTARINDKNEICTFIREPGNYIGIKTKDVDYNNILIQSIISSAIYATLALCILYQMMIILLGRVKRFKLKLMSGFLILTFLVIRTVYFILYPLGKVTDSVSYIFFEFPTFLFLIMESILIFIWIEIIQTMKILQPSKRFSRRLFTLWLIWNSFILICFVSFIMGYYVISELDKSDCSLAPVSVSIERLNFNKAYVIFVAFVCVILLTSIVISGYKLLRAYTENTNIRKSSLKFLVLTWLMASVLSVSLMIKSALMITSAFSDFTVPIIVFTLLENIPITFLMYYLRPQLSEQLKNTIKRTRTMSNKSSSKSSSKSKKSSSENKESKKSIRDSKIVDKGDSAPVR